MNKIIDWIVGWTNNGNLSALLFIPFALLVFLASFKLVKYAEVIIVKTKFGGAFIGGVLIAAVTSIPELISEIAQASTGDSTASISNELGSNAFSGFLIAITILVMFKTPFMKNLGKWSKVSLLISSIMSLILSIFMFTKFDVAWGVPSVVIGIVPLLTFLFFIYTLRLQYKYGDDDDVEPENIVDVSVKRAISWMVFWGIFLVLFSLMLNWTVDAMEVGYNINPSSAGGIFLAFAGSLPEVVAFIVLVKKKRYIGGVASLVGSHLFNLGITFFGDLVYHKAPYYTNEGMPSAAPLAILTGLLMLGLFVQSILAKRFKNNVIRMIIPSIIVVGYVIGWILMIIYS